MPQFNRRELDEGSCQYGFNRDTFEKVLRLKIILEYFNSQDYLKEHLLLKGGTAINLCFYEGEDLPEEWKCPRCKQSRNAERCMEQALSACSLLHLSADYSGKTSLIEIGKQPIKEYNKSVNNRQVAAG